MCLFFFVYLFIFYSFISSGNGTQDIFYSQSNPLYVSLHASDDFPWYIGDTTEIGKGEGEGYNVNIPLPKETNDEIYCKELEKVINERIISYGAHYLIVSLGGKLKSIIYLGNCISKPI